jgi:hypothetical protein
MGYSNSNYADLAYEFIHRLCYKKHAKARYKKHEERALARFLWQPPISIGGDGGNQVII